MIQETSSPYDGRLQDGRSKLIIAILFKKKEKGDHTVSPEGPYYHHHHHLLLTTSRLWLDGG